MFQFSGGGHRVPGKVLAVAPYRFLQSPESLPGEPILCSLAGLYQTRNSHLAGNTVDPALDNLCHTLCLIAA